MSLRRILVTGAALAGFSAQWPSAGESPAQPAVAGLDHIPIAVRDLDKAAEDFRRLGFVLKSGRFHANGILNQHAKFPDGTELELITAPDSRDNLTAYYLRHLAGGDGPAFLAFFAPEPELLICQLVAGKHPFKNDGGLVSLNAAPFRFLFFSRRNASPTDRPEHFAHANGAESLIGVWLAVEEIAAWETLFSSLGARIEDQTVKIPEEVKARVAKFAEGEVTLLPASRQLRPGRPIIGGVLRVQNLDPLRRVLAAGGITAVAERSSIFIGPQSTHGLWLEFREK